MIFLLLLRVRMMSVLNIVREQLRKSAWIFCGLTVLGAALFGATFVGFVIFFHLASQMTLLSETAYQVFYFLFLFLLAGSVPFVASTLLQSSDYSLLFAAPAPGRDIVAAKLIDATVTNSLQFMVLGVPALAACASVLDISAPAWLGLPLLIVLFVLYPALITALGLLILLQFAGVNRLRSAITVLNALMAAVACITIVLESPHLPIKPGMDLTSMPPSELAHASWAAHSMPSAWFVDLLVSFSTRAGRMGGPDYGALLRVVGGAALLALACMALGSRLLSAANLAEEGGTSSTINPGAGADLLTVSLSPPMGGLLRKDWRYLRRDSVLLSQLAMPMILFVVPFLLRIQDTNGRMGGETALFSSVIVGVILFMQTSILSLSSIGLESQAFWIVKTSPNSSRALVQAKFLFSFLFTSAVGCALSLVEFAAFGASPLFAGSQLGFVVVSAAALCGLGVGLSAAFPRFVYENPAHRVSTWAIVLGFFVTTGYVVVSGILFAAAWLITSADPSGPWAGAAYGVALTVYLVLSTCAAWIPLSLGARRIESYQWEH